jgi:hypothetical protein
MHAIAAAALSRQVQLSTVPGAVRCKMFRRPMGSKDGSHFLLHILITSIPATDGKALDDHNTVEGYQGIHTA